MNRRRSILAIGAALAARGLPARAQSGAVRVGFLSGGAETDTPAYLASFREGLAALGYREGDNLTLDVVLPRRAYNRRRSLGGGSALKC